MMRRRMPKVSVIIPNYNHAIYLPRRLDSIFKQTYKDFEIIYLDDHSKDNSNAVFREYTAGKDVKEILNDKGSGSTFKQWNKGAREAEGAYLWFAESDDWAHEDFLSGLVRVLDNNPEAGLAYCQSMIANENNQVMGDNLAWTDDLHQELWCNDFVMDGRLFCTKYLIFKNVIPNASAVLIRKKIWDKVGEANEHMRLCGDWLQWAKILSISNAGFVARPLNFFRCHPNMARRKFTSDTQHVKERYEVVFYIARNFAVSANTLENALNQLAIWWQEIIIYGPYDSRLGKLRSILKGYRSVKEFDSTLRLRILKFLYVYCTAKIKRQLKRVVQDVR